MCFEKIQNHHHTSMHDDTRSHASDSMHHVVMGVMGDGWHNQARKGTIETSYSLRRPKTIFNHFVKGNQPTILTSHQSPVH